MSIEDRLKRILPLPPLSQAEEKELRFRKWLDITQKPKATASPPTPRHEQEFQATFEDVTEVGVNSADCPTVRTELGWGLLMSFKDDDKNKPYLQGYPHGYLPGQKPGWYWLDRWSLTSLCGVYPTYEEALLAARKHAIDVPVPTIVNLVPLHSSPRDALPTEMNVQYKDNDKDKPFTTIMRPEQIETPGWYWTNYDLMRANVDPRCEEDGASPFIGPFSSYDDAYLAAKDRPNSDTPPSIIKFLPPSATTRMDNARQVELRSQIRKHTDAEKVVLCVELRTGPDEKHYEIVAVADKTDDLLPIQNGISLKAWRSSICDSRIAGFVWHVWVVGPGMYTKYEPYVPTAHGWYWISYPVYLEGTANYHGPFPSYSAAYEVCGPDYEIVQCPSHAASEPGSKDKAQDTGERLIFMERLQ